MGYEDNRRAEIAAYVRICHRISWPNHVWMLLQSVAQQGGLLVDNDNGTDHAAYPQWHRAARPGSRSGPAHALTAAD